MRTTEARRIEELEATLADLRCRVRDDALLAAGTIAAALLATRLAPELAWPLTAGSLFVAFLALSGYVRRHELIGMLARDPGAYAIAEVCRYGEKLARLKVRHELARSIRLALAEPIVPAQISFCREELEELAEELDSPEWAIDPPAAAACRGMVVDARESPLYDPAVPPELARSKVRQILAGLHRAEKPQGGSVRPPMAA